MLLTSNNWKVIVIPDLPFEIITKREVQGLLFCFMWSQNASLLRLLLSVQIYMHISSYQYNQTYAYEWADLLLNCSPFLLFYTLVQHLNHCYVLSWKVN